jgi:hypothetical protein
VQLDDGPADLAVVEVDAGVLECVPHALLKVVPVAAAAIGRIEMQFRLERDRKRLPNPPREESAHRLPVGSPFAAQERAVADVPVIPVDARRERQHKAELGYRGCPVRKGHRDVPRVSGK